MASVNLFLVSFSVDEVLNEAVGITSVASTLSFSITHPITKCPLRPADEEYRLIVDAIGFAGLAQA